MNEDAEISDLSAGDELNTFRACEYHATLYEGQASLRKCAKAGCWRVGDGVIDGIRLCGTHDRGKPPRATGVLGVYLRNRLQAGQGGRPSYGC